MRIPLLILTLAALYDPRAAVADAPHEPRVIITTDINNGSGDPDDRQSLCHLLWYADQLDIKAILPDRFSPTAIDACNIAFDLYEQDYNRPGTQFRALGFPTADHYRRHILVTTREAALQRIIDEANRDDPRPLWILAWGNLQLIGDALKKAPEIAPKLRLISIGTYLRAQQDGGDGHLPNWNGPGRPDLFENFPQLWWLEIDWTYNGMFVGPEAVQLKEDLARDAGALGQHIRDVIATVDWADYFRAGDTPSVLYLIDPDHDLDNPTQPSWAGSFFQPFPNERPHYWTGINGGEVWDYANPAKTWQNADAVLQARVGTLLRNRPAMYAALLGKVRALYGRTP